MAGLRGGSGRRLLRIAYRRVIAGGWQPPCLAAGRGGLAVQYDAVRMRLLPIALVLRAVRAVRPWALGAPGRSM
jgi:hypothetical protein